jgi:hypothetical protein
MKDRPDDRLTSWVGDSESNDNNLEVHAASFLTDPENGNKSEIMISRSGFLTWIIGLLSLIGLNGCAVFLSSKNSFVRRQRYQYCKCVPVCVCDMVCTCNLVAGQPKNEKRSEDQFTSENAGYTCKCVPVCTCDTVCTCNAQCTCQYQGGRRTICTCNPYWYPN